jgi:arylsulfatase A-like enzyme
MPRPPNILVFMTDQQRGDLALPDHPLAPPRLRAFAREGLQFTRAYCPSPHCCPSRASFFTGLYPSRHGVWNNVLNERALSRGLRPGVRLWSEDLRAAGYDLAFAGKWHLSADEFPSARGWRELSCVSALPGHRHGPDWALYQHLARAPASPSAQAPAPGLIRRPGWGDVRTHGIDEAASASRHDELAVAAAESFLRALPTAASGASASPASAPWCLYVGLNAPHDPYLVPSRYLERVPPAAVRLPPSFDDALRDRPGIYRRLREQVFGQLDRDAWLDLIRHYHALCLQADDWFGRVLDALAATGQADDTLVVFCSDHGDYLGDHGLLCKGIPCFESAYHVPALVRWPARLAAPGRVCDAFVSLVDFGPTFLEAAGLRPEKDAHSGASLLPFLRGEPAPAAWRDAVFTQCEGVELAYTQRSVRTRDWKYVHNGFDFDEFYDLRADPHETRNLAPDPAHRDTLRDLCARLWRFARAEGDTAFNDYWTVALAPHGPATAFDPPPADAPNHQS